MAGGSALGASYIGGRAPWDVGRPQPAIRRLAEVGAFNGAVLDAGCGAGENALCIAAQGLRVLGVDVAETALLIARDKAAERGLPRDRAELAPSARRGVGRDGHAPAGATRQRSTRDRQRQRCPAAEQLPRQR